MIRILCMSFLILFCTNVSYAETIARFGVITDIHHSNKLDLPQHKYTASQAKIENFVATMTRLKADFIVELGDMIDTLVDEKDPLENLREIESVFANFNGARYHVLGNHEFENMERLDFLSQIENTGISQGETYYSFNHKGIHCVVLDADYTVDEPHRPFDLQTEDNAFWDWKDAWIPEQQLDWLKRDLAENDMPTVIFTHQLLHRKNTEVHTVKNADAVRTILEKDGQVMAVFSGHDHRGEISIIKGIHYFVLKGNVGISCNWSEISSTDGLDPDKDNPFVLVEIKEENSLAFGTRRIFKISLIGNAQQYSFFDLVPIKGF